nr:hypothetical protein [Tanacetum cinerariifolium]
MEVFREIVQICLRLPTQEFDALPSDEEIVSFIMELGHKEDIKSITEVIENRDHKKQEKMYYHRFIKAIIHHLITKDKSSSMRNKMFMRTARDDNILGTMRLVSKSKDFQIYGAVLPIRMTNQQIRDTDAYKTYLAYATDTLGVSVSKKKTPSKAERSKGIDLLSEVALLEEARVKKVLRISRCETSIHQEGGSGDGTGSTPGVPDESKGKSVDTHKGTSLKPGLILLKAKSDDKPQHADDERTDSENQEANDDEDEFMHTPLNYVSIDDETNNESNDVTEEEYERINKELYDDVNAPQKTEGLILSFSISTDYAAKYLNFDNIPPVDTKVVSMLDINVQHQVPRTSPLLTMPVFVIPEHNVINPPETVTTASATTISSLLTSLFPHLQQSTPIPTPTKTKATTSTTVVSKSETLVALHQRIDDLEKDVKELKDVNNFTKVISTIQSEVLKDVK